jgi:hypothetical protein
MRLRIEEVQKVCMEHPGMGDEFWHNGTLEGVTGGPVPVL